MAKKSSSKTPSRAPKPGDRVVALVGKELFLRQEYTAQLRAALEAAEGAVDTVRFDGSSAPAADVLDECRSFGLLAGHKLVVVDDVDVMLNESTRPLFERYCESPCEGATLVLRASSWRAPRLEALVAEHGAFCACDEVTEPVALKWAGKRAKHAYGVSLDDHAARLLIDRRGCDLGRMDTELSKLAAGAGEGGTITRESVLELVGQSREEELWAVQAEVLSGDPARAIGYIRRLLEQAPRDAAVPVTFACVDLARKLAGANAGLRAGADVRALSSSLRLWGPAQQAVLGAAKRMTPAAARRLLHEAVDADAGQKSGLGRPDRVLERLAVRMTETIRTGGKA
ncbi:MAG: DNA polymerase III subunit delta [Phycisphaerales bacterium]